MKRTSLRLSALIVTAVLGTGCYTTTVRSGAAPGRTPVGYEDRWHHGFLWGLAEASGPYDINQLCPEGWAEIKTELTFLTGLVGGLTWGIYYPQSVTLVCGAGAVPVAPAQGYPVAAPPPAAAPAATAPQPEIGGPAPPPSPPPASTGGGAAPGTTPPGGAY